jgi:hypothetical protein
MDILPFLDGVVNAKASVTLCKVTQRLLGGGIAGDGDCLIAKALLGMTAAAGKSLTLRWVAIIIF